MLTKQFPTYINSLYPRKRAATLKRCFRLHNIRITLLYIVAEHIAFTKHEKAVCNLKKNQILTKTF